NVTILLDASGSMAGTVDGGVKMDLAKAAIKRFASSLPSHAQVSLRVYGHQGSNQEKDKAKSCASTEEVYPRSAYSEKKFNQALDQFKPTGWTPIAKGMEEAYQDLKGADKAENLIYVVSDGIETCGGNPEKMAKKLNQSNIQAMVNIIGFDVDNEGQQSLKNVAEAGGGKYETVQSEEELRDYFDDLQTEMWLEWADWGTFSWLGINKKQYTRLGELRNIIYNRFGKKINNEEERMYNVCDYMREELSIESGKVDDLSDRIGERNDKLETYKKERYESLKDSLMSNALEMKDKIEEMKDKKLNQYD
ncbi:Ca-activated chloride channel family protein, partial [Melghirimyces thermohalophilus]